MSVSQSPVACAQTRRSAGSTCCSSRSGEDGDIRVQGILHLVEHDAELRQLLRRRTPRAAHVDSSSRCADGALQPHGPQLTWRLTGSDLRGWRL